MIMPDVHAQRSRDEDTEYLSTLAKDRLTFSRDVPDYIRTKNRRKRYLDLHPEYFGPHLELADPLLYDRLIRRFQSTSERETEGRAKGYSGVLEADLWRGEAKLNALKNPETGSDITYHRGKDGEILAEERDEIPPTKEEGMERWRYEMERRFLCGGDRDFDYSTVDDSSDYDDTRLEDHEAEERYFNTESPTWMAEDGEPEGPERELKGQTGIQDF